MKLADVRRELGECTRCPLSGTRRNLVFGAGDPGASIVLVGEAPGAREDELGMPFVGAAGKLLDQMLATIDLAREDIYITNVLKCRPPANRDPRPEEIAACLPFLFAQLDAIRPRGIGALGNFATRVLLGRREGISQLRGRTFTVRGWRVLPMYHPAAALHNGALRGEISVDFARLAKRARGVSGKG
jgi:uracil-DNA glycosylase family 4